jgi:RNA polymerase sigma factor (sigma-70 family)
MGSNQSTGPTTWPSLFDGCRRSDNQAWTTFFGIYGPIVYRYARRAGLRQDDADEVVAAVMRNFVQALRRGFEVDHALGCFRHYLKKVANHEIAAQRRRRGRTVTDLDAVLDVPGREEPPEQYWREIEKQERLRICLERLSVSSAARPRDLLVFQRYAIQGEPPEQVARELGVSTSRVYAVKHEVIRQLRSLRIELDAILGEV